MTELDKKSLNNKTNQTDLVQSVLEAFEKKNQDRVDMLITNAVKQLKMSRFKPDQSTCIGLTYLARINPKIFHQSTGIREMLKSLLRRDAGPANIKGKSDMILPVLAANILLASCDSAEIRGIILNKLDQWLSSNNKVVDFVHHLLATICMKCQSDQQTINTLIEMRRHWVPQMVISKSQEDHSITTLPNDLSQGIRQLFQKEHVADQITLYLNFLDKYDTDYSGLSQALASLVLGRPITLASMFRDPEHGLELARCLVRLFIKLLNHFSETKTTIKHQNLVSNVSVKVKMEPGLISFPTDNSQQDAKISNLDKNTLEAILLLLTLIEEIDELREEWIQLANSSFIRRKDGLYDISEQNRYRLYLSQTEVLIDLSLEGANVGQLVRMLCLFGSKPESLDKIFKRLENFNDIELIRAEISDEVYFWQLIDFYIELGSSGAKEFLRRFE